MRSSVLIALPSALVVLALSSTCTVNFTDIAEQNQWNVNPPPKRGFQGNCLGFYRSALKNSLDPVDNYP
jgi:hypothetical protein